MKTNHIKSDKSLRGIGRLDWGSENKLHSTIKRITSLEDDSNKNPKKKNKERCPYCTRKVNTKNGKFVQHSVYSHSSSSKDICRGSKTYTDMREQIVSYLDSYKSDFNGVEVKVGDNVEITYSEYSAYNYITSKHKIKKTIKKIFVSTTRKDPQVVFDDEITFGRNIFNCNHHNIESYLRAPYYMKPINT